ncbi:MAG: efflux RND transporter permease subunit [Candidatus Manganitrophus sp.]|nr:MAG: efflux RND transporter permease subunit [Candidatus Manganitrophus sp.]
MPSGRIESAMREFTVLTETSLTTPEQFNDIIIRQVAGYPVRLKDVGHAELGAADDRNTVRVNGNTAVGLGIVKQSTANTLEVGQAIKAELPKLSAGLPEGMEFKIAFDTSVFIEESIQSVYKTIAEALILVVLVIFLFLRTLRATLIPFVTIPVSLIGGFFFLYVVAVLDQHPHPARAWCSRSVSSLTTPSSCWRTFIAASRKACSPYQAALEGSREIAFAVVAMTLTLVAVFVPAGLHLR